MNEKVLKLHIKQYRIFEKAYTNFICENRKNGCSREEAYYKAHFQLQEFVMNFTFTNPKYIEAIHAAYEEIKSNLGSITQAANVRYDLTLCNDEIKAKYEPLATM